MLVTLLQFQNNLIPHQVKNFGNNYISDLNTGVTTKTANFGVGY
jgi:hypothetical protein